MNKIYWSKNQDPEAWPSDVKTYWFPFAEWLCGRTWGKRIVMAYVALREGRRPEGQ